PGPIELVQAIMRRRRLALAKAIAARPIACSLCARNVGSRWRTSYSASPTPATLPCPKIAKTPANKGTSRPSTSLVCAARYRVSAWAIVRRIVVILGPFALSCCDTEHHRKHGHDQLLPIRCRAHRRDPCCQHRRPSRGATERNRRDRPSSGGTTSGTVRCGSARSDGSAGRLGHRCGLDRELDRHPRRFGRGGGPRRQGNLLRK